MRFRTCPLHGARVHLPVSQKDTPDQARHTPPAPPGAVARWGSALQRVRECTGGPRVRARAAARRGKCRQPRQTRQSCRHPASRRGAMLWGIWRSAVHALGGSRIGWWFARACPAAREVFGTLPRVPDRAPVPVCVCLSTVTLQVRYPSARNVAGFSPHICSGPRWLLGSFPSNL